jgi:hypothetical protein
MGNIDILKLLLKHTHHEIALNFATLTNKIRPARTSPRAKCFGWLNIQNEIQDAVRCAIHAHQAEAAIVLLDFLPKYRVHLLCPNQGPFEFLADAIAYGRLVLVKWIISRSAIPCATVWSRRAISMALRPPSRMDAPISCAICWRTSVSTLRRWIF